MSNRRKRQIRRRRTMTAHERYMADRYRPPRNYTTAQLRQIIHEDGVRRADIPLTWFVQAVTYIAAKDNLPRDTVLEQLDQACIAAVGLPLPRAGLTL